MAEMPREPTPRVPWRELRKRTQPRRGLALREAALYVGVNARKFARAVTRQEAPQPKVILGQTVWDIADLDDYIEQQPERDKQPKQRPRLIPPRI
jgi:predicted DNA-binding transcriptional regulator AlpA